MLLACGLSHSCLLQNLNRNDDQQLKAEDSITLANLKLADNALGFADCELRTMLWNLFKKEMFQLYLEGIVYILVAGFTLPSFSMDGNRFLLPPVTWLGIHNLIVGFCFVETWLLRPVSPLGLQRSLPAGDSSGEGYAATHCC